MWIENMLLEAVIGMEEMISGFIYLLIYLFGYVYLITELAFPDEQGECDFASCYSGGTMCRVKSYIPQRLNTIDNN